MYLSVDLIQSIQLRAAIPSSQTTFSPTNLYQIITEEMFSKLVPTVTRTIEDYWVTHQDLPIVANQANYQIPTRAVASALRFVEIVDSSDPSLEARVPLDRLNREDLYAQLGGNYRFTIKKTGFYVDTNTVIIYPMPTSAINTLRLTYVCRPNTIVDPSVCGQITNVNFATNQLTIAVTPGFTTTSVLDIVYAQPGFDWWNQNITPTAVSTTTQGATNVVLTFASGILSPNINVGDYVCPATQSCVVQVPAELQPLLAQYCVVRILSSQGDGQALQAAQQELEVLETNANLLIAPRSTGNPKRATNSRGINRWI